jgi:hypothetical protein
MKIKQTAVLTHTWKIGMFQEFTPTEITMLPVKAMRIEFKGVDCVLSLKQVGSN